MTIDNGLKTAYLALLGLFAFIVAGNNLVNLEYAHGAVGYVLGQSENEIYPNALFPALGPGAAWAVLAIICLCEFTAGTLCFIAAYRLFSTRGNQSAFDAHLPFARLAAASFALVWFVLFWIFGVAGYVMWQTAVGQESASSAFRISAFGFFVLLFLGQNSRARTA